MQGTTSKYAEAEFSLPTFQGWLTLSKEEHSKGRYYEAKNFTGQDYRARGGHPAAGATHF